MGGKKKNRKEGETERRERRRCRTREAERTERWSDPGENRLVDHEEDYQQ